jgi:hypothetical protein
MNTTPCRYYKADTINRVALDFEDAQVGRLVSVYTDGDDTNIALIINSNGEFVTTLAVLVRVTGDDVYTKATKMGEQIKRLAQEYVAPCNTLQFNKDIENIIHKTWNTDSYLGGK